MKDKVQTNTRLLFVDNLRWITIVFVVLMHSAVTYSGLGSWYYVENMSVGKGATLFFAFFQSFLQAFFMSLLFMLAGYFIPGTLQKKGTGKFIKDRLLRLGLPLVIYVFLIHILCVKLAYPTINMVSFYSQGIVSLDFLSWSGPLWFALVLLLFSIVYAVFSPFISGISSFSFSIKNIGVLIILITVFAFSIRLIYPVGTSVMNLQFCYFAAYCVMFIVGTQCYNNHLFERISLKMANRLLAISFGIGIPVWLAVLILGNVIKDNSVISGGMRWQAFGYAFWESFFCVTFIVALIGIFFNKFNSQNAFQKILSQHAFAVYVFHAPILIAVTVLSKPLIINPVLKFLVCGLIAVTLSFMFAILLRMIPVMKRIFS